MALLTQKSMMGSVYVCASALSSAKTYERDGRVASMDLFRGMSFDCRITFIGLDEKKKETKK
jgi:hypothetical protein